MNTDRITEIQQTIGLSLAQKAFAMGAIRLNTIEPFQWASGYRMPIYNDNRQLLRDAEVRALVAEGFFQLLEALGVTPDSVAGTATAGIPHATTLADRLGLPLTYIRSSSKGHGLKNAIEGLPVGGTYEGQSVVLIEDLISTGGSSIKAVEAITAADGKVPYCLAIFTYGLQAALDNFAALDPACTPITILTYDIMVEAAVETGYIDKTAAALLTQWKQDPFGWGEANGFPKVER